MRLTLTENNWEYLWQTTQTAQDVITPAAERFYPIPDITCPVQLESSIIAVWAYSQTANERWKSAGKVSQIIRTGIVVGGQADSVNSVKPIWLNQSSVIVFPNYAAQYELTFSIPFWIRDINLTVWEYTGAIVEELEPDLNQLQADISAIKAVIVP